MTNYTLWADRGTGSNDIYKIAEYLKKCAGGSVKVLGIGPSVGQNYGLHNGKGTVAVYQTNGVGLATPNDLEMGCAPGGYYQYDRAIFVWPQWIGNQYMSDKNIKSHTIPGEWDWNRSSAYNVGGKTAVDWFPNAKYVDLVAGTSPEDVANRICNQVYVTSTGNPGSSNTAYSSGKAGYTTKSTSEETSATSPLLNGEMTFQELVAEICKGVDLTFLCKRSTVYVADFMDIYSEAVHLRENYHSSISGEDIKLWQLEEDSYELNIDHHGFYNTVFVVYKNGIVKESFADFVQIYGEISVTYYDKKLDKTSAKMKAKAYLAAHVRDFELTVQATILSEPDIDIGDMVTLNNPKTNNNVIKEKEGFDSELLFVKGLRTEWEGDGMITSDLELQYAPTSPDRKEVPTAGIYSNKQDDSSSSSEGSNDSDSFDKYGVSKDGTKIMAIGRPSAEGELNKYGYKFYKSIFKRHCPFCGSDKLHWGIFFAGNETSDYGIFPATGGSEGSSAEGIIHCSGCDADFSCITGADHMSPPRAYLDRISGPTKCSKQDAYNLKRGKSG